MLTSFDEDELIVGDPTLDLLVHALRQSAVKDAKTVYDRVSRALLSHPQQLL